MSDTRRAPREATLRADYAHCFRIARHAENFPVASLLLPRSFRPHLAAIYAYARGADDLADEVRPFLGGRPVSPDTASRLAALDTWEAGLDGDPPPGTEPLFRALAATRRACELPEPPLRALLDAFRYDARHHGYATWNHLLAYARSSAASIGRLVLAVAGARDPALVDASDDLCVALQLTNFWQDLSVDWPRGRLTLPEAEWSDEHLNSDRLRSLPGSSSERWAALSESERARLARALEAAADRTETLYQRSRALSERTGKDLRGYLGAVWQGGHIVLARVGALGPRAFVERPALRWTDRARIAWHAATDRL